MDANNKNATEITYESYFEIIFTKKSIIEHFRGRYLQLKPIQWPLTTLQQLFPPQKSQRTIRMQNFDSINAEMLC